MKKHTRKQKLREARRKVGLKNLTKKPRQKKISPRDWDDFDDIGFDNFEPIMPRDENERRREIEKQITYSSSGAIKEQSADPDGMEIVQASSQDSIGLVVEVGSGLCRVDLDGRLLLCEIRGYIKDAVTGYVNYLAVGDQVRVQVNGSDRGVVEHVLPRRSVLARPYSPDQGKVIEDLKQIVAANVDQLLIVASWREPYIWPAIIDRYLIAARRNKIKASICINKIDLIDDQAEFDQVANIYQDLGNQVITTSTILHKGIDELDGLLRNKITVLAGLSGVGKSSLLNAIQPNLNLKVGDVSEHGLFTGQGRHTTTQSSLLKLNNGGVVIDTPGVRSFAISGILPSELASWYPDMIPFVHKCRFGNCTHINEPDCGIKNAVKQGAISQLRYKNYTQIFAEIT